MQGFDDKNQIYLNFCGKALLLAQTCDRTFEGFPLRVVGRSTFQFDICKLFNKKVQNGSIFYTLQLVNVHFSLCSNDNFIPAFKCREMALFHIVCYF